MRNRPPFGKIDRKVTLSALVVFLAAVAAFGSGLTNGFLIDDHELIVNNYELHGPQDLDFAFDSFLGAYFRPVTLLSFALDYALWQYKPFGYHLTSILLHGINAILLMGLVGLLARNRAAAFFSALLFAIHPIHSIPVNYIADRGNLLAANFMLPALLVIFSGTGKKPAARFVIVFLLSLLAMLSRESAVTFPAYVFVLFWCLEKDALRSRRNIWLLTILAFLSLAYLSWRMHFIRIGDFVLPSRDSLTLPNLFNFCRALLKYLQLLIIPTDMVFRRTIGNGPAESLLISLAALIFCGLLIFRGTLSDKVSRAGLLWLLTGLLTVSGFIFSASGNADLRIQDNQIYFVSIGFFILAGRWLSLLREKLPSKTWLFCVFAMVSLYASRTMATNKLYASDETYNSYWLRASPAFAYTSAFGLAKARTAAKDHETAIALYRRSLTGKSIDCETYLNLGNIYLDLGEVSAAAEYYDLASRINPDMWQAWNNLGLAYLKQKEPDRAVSLFEKATQTAPKQPLPRINLAVAYAQQGKIEESISIVSKLWQRWPEEESWGILLVRFYLQNKEEEKAFQAMEKIISSSQNMVRTLEGLAEASVQAENWGKAEGLYREIIKRAPRHAQAYLNLGILVNNRGETEEAVELWRQGQQIDPSDPAFEDYIKNSNASPPGP